MRLIALTALSTSMLFIAHPVLADDAPTIAFEGILGDASGTPLDETVTLHLSLYSDPVGGGVLWNETHAEVRPERGLFVVHMGSNEPLDPALFDGHDLYVGLSVNESEEMAPRVALTWVPHALHARHAQTADEAANVLSVEEIVSLVAGEGFVLAGDEFKGLVTALLTELGLIEPVTESRVDEWTANNGYASQEELAPLAIAAQLSDQNPATTPVDFADLANVPADDDTLAGLGCQQGEIARFDGAAWTCGQNSDSVLTEEQVDEYAGNNGYAMAAALATVAISGSYLDLTDVPADADALASLDCVDGQVARFDGTNWACADAADTQLTEEQVDAFADNNGYAMADQLAAVAVTGSFNDLSDIPADQDSLASLNCVNGQVAKWGGQAWECGLDADTKLTPEEVDLAVSDNGFAIAANLATVATSGSYNDLTDQPEFADTLAGLSCDEDEIPRFVDDNWSCAEDNDSKLSDQQVIDIVTAAGFGQGGGGSIPSGAILMFDGNCPDGYTRYEALDNRFPMGSDTPEQEGGTEQHSHEVTGNTGSAIGAYFTGSGGGPQLSRVEHTHAFSVDSEEVEHIPPYRTVVFCRKD